MPFVTLRPMRQAGGQESFQLAERIRQRLPVFDSFDPASQSRGIGTKNLCAPEVLERGFTVLLMQEEKTTDFEQGHAIELRLPVLWSEGHGPPA